MKSITILVPCYNEAAVLELFYNELRKVIKYIEKYTFEILFINDGSVDETLNIIKRIRKKDLRVSYIDLSRNFGKEAAMIAGLDYIKSDAVIIMDTDLQDPPDLIPAMITAWEEGYDDVSAKRKHRKGETFCKRFSSMLYYRI